MGKWIRKRWDNGKMLSRMKPAAFVSIAACFMLFVFAPLEIYLSNPGEFWYDAYMLFPFLAKDFFFFLAASMIGFAAAYFLGDWIYTAGLYCYFTVFAGCYIQGNFMVSGLPPFDGTDVNWDLYRPEAVRCGIVWAVAAAVILALCIWLKGERFRRLVSYVGIFMFCVLLSTLTVMGINGGLLDQKQFVRFTKTDLFEMSEDTNFIILLLDAIDEEVFWKVWEEHPEYEGAMADFTYFNNAMSGYAYTEHSLPLMVSGEWFECQEPFKDYYLRVYRDSPFFNRLEEEGYSLAFYESDIQFEVGEMEGEFTNLAYAKYALHDAPLFNSRIMKMTGIKYAPYPLKPYCWFNPDKIKHQRLGANGEELFVWDNKAFYEDVQQKDISYAKEKKFKLIHLMGAHVPFLYDQYVNETEDADYYTSIESSMTVTMAYLEKLKEAGVYDNSVILVLSDHGYNISGDAVKIPQKYENAEGRQHPVLFIKGLNESHPLRISGAPVSYADLVEAYYRLMEGSASEDCFDYREEDYRERRYLLYRYLEEDHMVEYMQTGYAGDEETMIPTGKVFDAK